METSTKALAESAAALGNQLGGNYNAMQIALNLCANYSNTVVFKETLRHRMEQCKAEHTLQPDTEEKIKEVIAQIEEYIAPNIEYWGEIKVLFSDKIENLVVSYYQNDCSGYICLDGNEVAEFNPDFSQNVYILQDDTGRQWSFSDIQGIMNIAENYVEAAFDIKPIANQKKHKTQIENEL